MPVECDAHDKLSRDHGPRDKLMGGILRAHHHVADLPVRVDGRYCSRYDLAFLSCVYRKLKPGRSGDGVRLGWGTI